ncbi:hypothetical protein KC349_g189 [Hortaea werneckii]|nr:hypothetical protein KC349_g189 [Hortaea werneckii]
MFMFVFLPPLPSPPRFYSRGMGTHLRVPDCFGFLHASRWESRETQDAGRVQGSIVILTHHHRFSSNGVGLLENHTHPPLELLTLIMLQHLISLLDAIVLLDPHLAAIVSMQLHHVLALLRRADQLAADLLLLEVKGEGVDFEVGCRGESDVWRFGVDHDAVDSRVGVVEGAHEFFGALLFRLGAVDQVGPVGLQAADADLSAPLAGLRVDGEKGAVDGGASAEEWRRLVPWDLLRDLRHDARVRLHVLGEASVKGQAEHTGELLAELLALLASIALVAEAVRVDAPDTVTELDASLACFGSGLDYQTSGLMRADETWLCACGCVDTLEDLQVRVAVACSLDLNQDVIVAHIGGYIDIGNFIRLVKVLDAGCAHLLGD